MRLLILSILLLALASVQGQTAAGCTDELYIKAYHYPEGNMLFHDHALTPTSEVITVGTLRDPLEVSDGIIVKTAPDGSLLWAKTFRQPGGQEFLHILASRDGNFLILGSFTGIESEGLILLKIDADGNILWQKSYTADPIFLTIGWFSEDAQGNSYLSGNINEDNQNFQDRVTLMSFDHNGNIRFSKFYRPPTRVNITKSREVIIDGEYAYLCGNAYNLGGNIPTGLIVKIRKEDGHQIWAKTYSFNDAGANFNHLTAYGDSLRVIGYDQLNISDTTIILVCDKDGKVGRGRYFAYPYLRQFGIVHQAADGGLVFSDNYFVSSLSLCKIDLDRGVQWSRIYDHSPGSNWMPLGIHAYPGGFMVSGRYTQGPDNGFLARVNVEGLAGCDPKTIPIAFGSGTFAMTNSSYPDVTLALKASPVVVELKPYSGLSSEEQCHSTHACTRLSLSGPGKACTGDTIRYVVAHDTDCHLPVNYTYDGTLLEKLSEREDSTWFRVKNGGRTQVKASFGLGCTFLNDVLPITLSPEHGLPDLGQDRFSCNGHPVTLDAGNGFISYQWQDGSTGQLYTATAPGHYSVRVTDGNGCGFSDSVNILDGQAYRGFLPSTAIICRNGALMLKPTEAFAEYLWSNGSKQSALTVTQPGLYWLQVKDAGGCTGSDSTQVNAGDCNAGFYAPNAFTPGHDGLNDLFRPLLTGVVGSFRLMVFNRYGEKVYDGSDPKTGWDGTMHGINASDGNYSWICVYQLAGQPKVAEKGTVTLIR
jgi:gliding motility-associated-like protein